MRVRHRWLLLSIFVAAILVVTAMLGNRRTVHSGVTVSFLGYTNLADSPVRSAVFVVHYSNLGSIYAGQLWLEDEGLEDHKAHSILAPISPVTIQSLEVIASDAFRLVQTSEGGYSSAFAVDELSESGRWRASWVVCNGGLRVRFLAYAANHRLLPKNWVFSLLNQKIHREWFICVTNSSIWLTNFPQGPKEH
jgi:hypothetical protein